MAIAIIIPSKTITAKSSTKVKPFFTFFTYLNDNKFFKNSIAKLLFKYKRSILTARNGPNGSIFSSLFTVMYIAYGKAKNEASIM